MGTGLGGREGDTVGTWVGGELGAGVGGSVRDVVGTEVEQSPIKRSLSFVRAPRMQPCRRFQPHSPVQSAPHKMCRQRVLALSDGANVGAGVGKDEVGTGVGEVVGQDDVGNAVGGRVGARVSVNVAGDDVGEEVGPGVAGA